MTSEPQMRYAARVHKELIYFEEIGKDGDPFPEGTRAVYVLDCLETKRFKIGVSNHPRRRLKQIQAMSPSKLSLLFIWFTRGQELETFLHQRLDLWRLHGEWFESSHSSRSVLQAIEDLKRDSVGIPPDKRLALELESTPGPLQMFDYFFGLSGK